MGRGDGIVWSERGSEGGKIRLWVTAKYNWLDAMTAEFNSVGHS
jgi:hypothetical protein